MQADMDAVQHLTNKLIDESRKNGTLENTIKELRAKVSELEVEVELRNKDANSHEKRAKEAEVALLSCKKECNQRNIERTIQFARSSADHLRMYLKKNENINGDVFKLLKLLEDQWGEVLKKLPVILEDKNVEYNSQIEDVRRGTRLNSLKPIEPAKIPVPPHISRNILDKLNIIAQGVSQYKESVSNECIVCYHSIDGVFRRRCPKCEKVYHKDCLDQWLLRDPTCPQCRQPLALY